MGTTSQTSEASSVISPRRTRRRGIARLVSALTLTTVLAGCASSGGSNAPMLVDAEVNAETACLLVPQAIEYQDWTYLEGAYESARRAASQDSSYKPLESIIRSLLDSYSEEQIQSDLRNFFAMCDSIVYLD